LAVICACNAGLFHDALHEVYQPRIQRGNKSFAANVLGVRGALLSALAAFFEQGHWGSLRQTDVEGQSLSGEDQLYILTQAGLYLTDTRGLASAEARICYERAEFLCHSLNRPLLLFSTLMGQWRYSLVTQKLTATLQIAERIYSLARKQGDPAPIMGAYNTLAATHYYLGDDFELARQYAVSGVQIWRSEGVQTLSEEGITIGCLFYKAICEWNVGEIALYQATKAEMISLAKELNNMNTFANALYLAAMGACLERNPAEIERFVAELIEISTRYNFAFWLPGANVLRGWVQSVSGETIAGISLIKQGIEDYKATGSMMALPVFLALEAEALHLEDRTQEALKAIGDAEALAERFENRHWSAELHRFRGVFLTAMGASDAEIEASFRHAISTAKQQKAATLATRAEASYVEYRARRGAPGL
jgi:predicted ATPase